MKTENTPQEKAKFFAQYWGQFLKTSDNHKTKGLKPLEIDSHSIQYVDEHSFLELTPLKNISDEDAIEVARIALNKDTDWNPIDIIKWDWCTKIVVNREPDISKEGVNIEMYIIIDFQVNKDEIFFTWDYIYDNGIGKSERHLPNSVSIYDYLRSKSYLLPYKDLSTEDLIAYGWAKEIEK